MKSIKKPIQPGLLMSLYWMLFYAVYLLAPIHQVPVVSAHGLLFAITHISIFVIGSTLCARFVFSAANSAEHNPGVRHWGRVSPRRESELAGLALLIGICGGVLSAYGKLSLIEEFSLAAVASLRTERAQELLYAGAVKSQLASVIAFFAYPAGFVGLVATLLRYERMPRGPRLLAAIYIGVVFLLTIIAGGRSPVLVLLLFMAISCYLRGKLGLVRIPASRPLRLTMLLLLALFIGYSSIIWVVRTQVSGLNVEAFLMHADAVWGVRPSVGLVAVCNWLERPELVQNIMSSIFYFTQNLSVTERILDARNDIVPLLGAYQVDLVAALLRSYPAGAEFLADGNRILLNENIYGFFAGAWGSLFVDFGYFSVLGALLWGYISGRSHRNLRRKPGLGSEIKYVFWTYSIFISFVSPPFGFSNSFITFVWFVLFGVFLSMRLDFSSPRMQEAL